MSPFNFLGQNTGSLVASFDGIIYDAAASINPNSPFQYIILSGQSGLFVLYYPYQPQGYVFNIDNPNYLVTFAGDFFGNSDLFTYVASMPSGDVYGGLKDFASTDYVVLGNVQGMPYDFSTVSYELLGLVESGLNDYPTYSLSINYGAASGILTDRPIYSVSISLMQASGMPKDNPSYSIGMNGKIDRIYKDVEYLSFTISGGGIGRGSVLSIFNSGDTMAMDFYLAAGGVSYAI